MSFYVAEIPDGVFFDPEYRKFLKDFYATSDIPGAHEKYANQFTLDATVIMASHRVKGTTGIISEHFGLLIPSSPDFFLAIIEMRKKMWEKVASRKHTPEKIYPFGSNSDHVMIHGVVDYVNKDGKQAHVDWAARGHLVKVEHAIKMDFYQVYLVCNLNQYMVGGHFDTLQDTAAQNAAM